MTPALSKGQGFSGRVGRKSPGPKDCLDFLSLLTLQAQLLLTQSTELCLCTQALIVVLCVSSEHLLSPLNIGDVGLGRKLPIEMKLWNELQLSIQNVEHRNAFRLFSCPMCSGSLWVEIVDSAPLPPVLFKQKTGKAMGWMQLLKMHMPTLAEQKSWIRCRGPL